MAPHSPVEAVLEHAGATMVDRCGQVVPLHFGSSAGELAACSVAVGLADRGDLALHAITGDVEALEHVTHLLTGTLLAPGSALVHAGATWCATSQGRLLVVGEPTDAAELEARIAGAIGGHPGVRHRSLADALAGFELLGPRTDDTLTALGVPRTLAPAVQTVALDGVPVTVVRRSWARALILVDPVWAAAVWAGIDRAGASFGVTCVGADAVERFPFVERLLT